MSEPMSDEELEQARAWVDRNDSRPSLASDLFALSLLREVERLRSLVAARGAALERIRDDYGDVWGGSTQQRGAKGTFTALDCVCCGEWHMESYEAIVHDVDCPVSIAARSLVISLGGGGEGESGPCPAPSEPAKTPEREPTCKRVCALSVLGDGEPHDDDYCDLYEASEIGAPCAGLCHADPRQPFDGICPRCGTHGNDGEACKVCVPAPAPTEDER